MTRDVSGASRSLPTLATAIAVVLAAALQIAAFHGLRHDDAYITFRYGQNLALGRGLVFNPGDRVMATSPLHQLASAVVLVLVGPDRLPSVMSALGCLGWTGPAIALFFLLRSALGQGGAGFVAAAVLAGVAGSESWVALETNEAAAFCLLAVCLAYHGRWTGTAVAAALAGITRPDTYVLSALLAVWCVHHRRRGALWPATVFLAVSAPWYVFAVAYYGWPIPQSAVAKYHLVAPHQFAGHLLGHVPARLLPFSLPWSTPLVWVGVVGGAVWLSRRDRQLAVLPAWAVLLSIAYIGLGPPPPQTWHVYPIVLVAAVLVLSLMVLAGARVASWRARSAPAPPAGSRAPAIAWPRTMRVVAFALALVVVGAFTARTRRTAILFPIDNAFGDRDANYRAVAAHLREHARARDVLSAWEVGTVAYFADLPVNDLSGLVTREPIVTFDRAAVAAHHLRWMLVNADCRWVDARGGTKTRFQIRSHRACLVDLAPEYRR